MQAVILAGGLATRLRPLTSDLPKSLVPIAGRPFVAYQLEALRAGGVTEVVMCIGHLAAQLIQVVEDGSRFGLRVTYSRETGALLGTAGALRHARSLLRDAFIVTYGDSYLPCDYRVILGLLERADALGVVVVYRNYDRYDRSNVVVGDGLVRRYDKREHDPEMTYIDAGVLAFKKGALDRLPPADPASLDEHLLPQLARAGRLLAHESAERFYEVGSFTGIEDFEGFLRGSARA